MKRTLTAIILVITSMLRLTAAPDIKAFKGEVKDGYNFWLYTPPGVSAGPKPLIVFLHGASLCGTNLDKVKRYGTLDAVSMGRQLDAYVIAPQNPRGSWSPRRVMNCVDYIERHCAIDTARVYVIGMSLGGYGSIDLASTYPDRIAAAIAMCGGATSTNLSGLNQLPLWIVHGTADRAVSVKQSDRIVESMERSRADGDSVRLTYDRVDGWSHASPAKLLYTTEIYDWLLSHRLDEPGRPRHKTPVITEQLMRSAYAGLSAPKRKSHRRHRKR